MHGRGTSGMLAQERWAWNPPEITSDLQTTDANSPGEMATSWVCTLWHHIPTELPPQLPPQKLPSSSRPSFKFQEFNMWELANLVQEGAANLGLGNYVSLEAEFGKDRAWGGEGELSRVVIPDSPPKLPFSLYDLCSLEIICNSAELLAPPGGWKS